MADAQTEVKGRHRKGPWYQMHQKIQMHLRPYQSLLFQSFTVFLEATNFSLVQVSLSSVACNQRAAILGASAFSLKVMTITLSS